MNKKISILMFTLFLLIITISFADVEEEDEWWQFNDDFTSNSGGVDLEITAGDPSFVAGKLGKSVDFDGDDELRNASGMTPLTTASFSGWIKAKSATATQYIFIILDSGSVKYYLNIGGTNDLRMSCGGVGDYIIVNDATNILNTWTHIAGFWNTSNVVWWLNVTQGGAVSTNCAGAERTGGILLGRGTDGINTYTGEIDDLRIYRDELINISQVNDSYNSGHGSNASQLPTPPPPPSEELTITAKDIYDSATISNFTVTIYNSTDTYVNLTTTGSITYNNITNGLYNINFTAIRQNGSYFDRSYTDYNVSNDIQGNFTQSYLSLNVTDLLTNQGASSFTVYTNYSTHSGTDGYILLPSKAGYHTFNITSTNYPLSEFSYTISALENLSFTANISPKFQFYLRREADNSLFDVNKTNSTKLTIYCPNKNIVVDFRNESYNSTQENVTMDCPYTLMKIFVDYSGSTYFRTLIPPTTQQNITWWLLDLNKDTGVQIILELIDLVGEWASGLLRVRTAIGETDEDIIEQEFDISDAVVLYLLKDAFYTLSIENAEGAERALGSLIADAAGTKTITYPNIPFYPEESILEDNLSWSYTFNTTAQILRLQYEDNTAKTTYLRWRIYNGTNASHLLSSFTANSNSSLIFTYQPVHANNTYFTHLHIEHPDLDYNISQYRTFSDYQDYYDLFEGFEDIQNLTMYISIIFLVVWGLLFSAKHAGLGMTSTFIWALILKWRGFFPISWLWLGLIGFISILGWVVEAMKK